MWQEPLCPLKVLPLTARRLTSRQRQLLLLHRSYWLMRRTKCLPSTSVVPISMGLCRLLSVPADRWPFPTLSLQSLYRRLDPYPVMPFRCIYPFLLGKQRPRHSRQKLGAFKYPCKATSTENGFSGLQSFSNVQAPILIRPPGCTHR
jgi:hypothetical protein